MRSLFSYWHLDGVMAIFLICICLGYFYMTHFKIIKKSIYFFTGLLLIILSVVSPLQFLAENYLMSAHMASHVILLLIASPLLVMGIPETGTKVIQRFSETLVKFPWLPWMAGVCIMWFWHIPAMYNHLFETQDANITNGVFTLHILRNVHLISLILCGNIIQLACDWPGHFAPHRTTYCSIVSERSLYLLLHPWINDHICTDGYLHRIYPFAGPFWIFKPDKK